jgi:hypothetical protein
MNDMDLGLDDVFQGTYLKCADLEGQEHLVVIATAVPKIMGSKEKPEHKVEMTFQGWGKPFLCNKTNGERIAFRHGRKFRGWIGKEIILYPDLVDFQGKPTEAIRIKHPINKARPRDDDEEMKGEF